jgi:hypothetical protein
VATVCLPCRRVTWTVGPVPVHSTVYWPGLRGLRSTMVLSCKRSFPLLHQWKADCPGTGTEPSQPAVQHVRFKVRTKERVAPISFRSGREGMGIGLCEFLVASCAPSSEPSHSKTSEITLGLDSLQGGACRLCRIIQDTRERHEAKRPGYPIESPGRRVFR